jgi:hypothetical protein
VAVLQFKFDESYDDRFMSIGGWLAHESEWKRLESSWKNCIDRLNFNNRPDQQITRFHATYMNRYEKEFLNWTPEMSAQFANKLTGFIGKRNLIYVSIGADMHAMRKVFPKSDPKSQDNAYTVCIKIAMVEIGHIMRRFYPNDQVHIVHDKGNWDLQALAAYNLMADDLEWNNRELFVGITSMTGSQSVGLQAADLIAFESYKALFKKLVHNSDEMRKAMQALYFKGTRGVHKYLDLKGIEVLKKTMYESGKYPKLDEGG